MYHKLIAMVTIAVVITSFSQASGRKLDSAELKTLFSDTTVNWTNRKGIKVTLSLNSDGSAKVLAVTPQGKVRREGKWWIKEPNIHCVKWVNRKKNICRKIGNVEESGEGWTTNRKGITWTITKVKEKTITKAKENVVVSENGDGLYFGDLNFGEPKKQEGGSQCGVNNIKRWSNNRYVHVFFIMHADYSLACGLKTGSDDPEAMARLWFNKKVTLDNFGKKTSIKTEYIEYTYQGFRLKMGSFSSSCYSFVSETVRNNRRIYMRAAYCGRDQSKEAFLGNLRKIRFADQSP